MKKILVTGGAGYIGSHTVVELLESEFEVIVIDNLSNSEKEIINRIKKITNKNVSFYEIDMCDLEAVRKVVEKEKNIIASIHLAAYKAVGESVNLPLKYYKNNLNSLLNLLQISEEFGIKHIVFSSSCTVYGEPDKLPVTEKSPIKKAESPYGNTKQIAEEIIEDFIISKKNFSALALRYFNPIGAHSSALIGELPRGVPNNLVPFVSQTAIGIRNELKIFGNDYNTPDGTCIRDYINVVDLAKAHTLSMKRLLNKENKVNFEAINLGTGKGVSVLEIVKTFEKVSGVNINYTFTQRRPGDVEQIYANVDYAKENLKWEAKKTLEETLLSAWNWEKALRNKN